MVARNPEGYTPTNRLPNERRGEQSQAVKTSRGASTAYGKAVDGGGDGGQSYEEHHYGGDPHSGSDLERMRSGGGLATGRKSPRIPKRVNVGNAVLVERGLASAGDVDPNQGRLFSHETMGHYTKSDAEMSQETGVPYRRPAGQGWMTGVGQSPTQPHATIAAAKAAGSEKGVATRSKRLGEVGAVAREKLQSETPARTTLLNRQRFETDEPTNWYAGGASEAIHNEAVKSGLATNPNGHNVMRRAVALTSPQKPWDKGHGQDNNYQLENVGVAGHLVRHLTSEQQRLGKDYDPKQAALSFRMPGDPKQAEAKGLKPEEYKVEGQSKAVRKSVAQHLDEPTHEGPQLATDVQKVRNFDVALAAGHKSRWARRQAAQAYTSDTHDIRAMGVHGVYQSWVGAPASSGGYEFAAMTGRRGAMRQSVRALKEGRTPRTPSEYQENIWVGKRNVTDPSRPSPGTKAPKRTITTGPEGKESEWDVPGGTGPQALFKPGANGTEAVSKLALPGKLRGGGESHVEKQPRPRASNMSLPPAQPLQGRQFTRGKKSA